MIINFATYANAKKAEQMAIQAEHEAELARRARLEQVLADLLAELEAA